MYLTQFKNVNTVSVWSQSTYRFFVCRIQTAGYRINTVCLMIYIFCVFPIYIYIHKPNVCLCVYVFFVGTHIVHPIAMKLSQVVVNMAAVVLEI